MTTTHELKCWPEYFGPVADGIKTVELRKDDRDYQVGDYLLLREFKPNAPHQGPGAFTGRTIVVQVTHIARGFPWLTPGYVALSIRQQRAELDRMRRWAHVWKSRARTWRPIARQALEVVRHERAACAAYRLHADALSRENIQLVAELDALRARIAELEAFHATEAK